MTTNKESTWLIISTATGYGGAERSMELLAPELAKTAHVVVLTGNGRHRDNLLAARERSGAGGRLQVWPLPFDEGRRGTLESMVRVAWARTWLRPAVIIANTERSARVLALAEWLLPGGRASTWIYVRDFMWRDLPGVLRRLPSAGVLVPGKAVLDREGYLRPWAGPGTGRRLRIVPDMAVVPRDAAEGAEWPRDGWALHLATVNPWKGHAHLIRAAELLRESGRFLRIRSRGLTGNVALRAELERRVEAAGLAGDARFELLEHAECIQEELRGCFCVVVASVGHSGGPETFGRTIIEAWACGRPVVAFAAGEARHLIEHEVDGLLVREGDEQGLADALWRLRTDPALAKRLGARGFEKVARSYESGRVADQLRGVVSEPEANAAKSE